MRLPLRPLRPLRPGLIPAMLRCLALLLLLLPGLAEAQTAWVQSMRSGNQMHFLFSNTIQRYDLTTGTWLGTITLPRSGATALTGDASGNFVAYGTRIFRYTTAYTGEAAAGTAISNVASLFLDGDILIAVHPFDIFGRLTSFNRNTGVQLHTIEATFDSIIGASYAPGLNKVFGRGLASLPSEMNVADYSSTGMFSGIYSPSPNSGLYPQATKTFTAPDERRVIDSSGTIYYTADLSFLGNLGGTVTDLDWNGDVPIVLRGSEVLSFSNLYQQTGKVTLATPGVELAVTGADAFVFAVGTPRPTVRIIPLSQLQAQPPGQPVNPSGLSYPVDATFRDKDGIIHLLSKSLFHIFRWSLTERRYLPNLPLTSVPANIAYCASSHSIFTVAGRSIQKIDLRAAVPQETAFASLDAEGWGLACAGEYLYASGRTPEIKTFSPAGALLFDLNSSSFRSTGSSSPYNTFDPVGRRIYHFTSEFSPSNLVYERIGPDGMVQSVGGTPYNRELNFAPPILVSPDGEKVVIGSGVIFDAEKLYTTLSLPNSIADGVWRNSTLFTARADNGWTQVQSWNGAQFATGTAVGQISGTPVRVFDSTEGLLLITSVNGVPRFTLLNDALVPVFSVPLTPAQPESVTVITRRSDSVSLRWADRSDNEDGFRVEYRPAGSTATWLTGASAASGSTEATVTGLPSGSNFEFRVLSTNGTVASLPNATVTARTLTSPEQPAGEPYSLAITRIYHNNITLQWKDNASNETAFRLLRSTTPTGTTTSLTAAANATSFTDTTTVANTTYYYRIQAVNGAVTGDLSSQVMGRTLATAAIPASPSEFAFSNLTAHSVRLTWVDNSSNEDYFLLEQYTGVASIYKELLRPGFNSTSIELTDLSPNTEYNLRLSAVNASGKAEAFPLRFTTPKLGGDFLNMAMRAGDIYYFAFRGPNRIERYGLVRRLWLPAVPMEITATALWVDEDGIYAASNRTVFKWSLDGATRTTLTEATHPINSLATVGNILVYFPQSQRVTTINKQTGGLLATLDSYSSGSGAVYDPVRQRIFMRGVSSIGYLDIGPDGQMIRTKGLLTSERTEPGGRPFIFPSQGRLSDNSGTVYSSDSLQSIASLGAPFTDMAFRGNDVPILLRGNKLFSYTNTLSEAGSFTLSSASGQRLAVQGNDAITFIADGSDPRGITLQIVPMEEINAPFPGLPITADSLPFSVDDAFMDRDGLIHLYSKAQASLFRWSPAGRRYLSRQPLLGVPPLITYSNTDHVVFTGYENQSILRMDLSNAVPTELPFASLTEEPVALTTAGSFLFADTPKRTLTFAANASPVSNLQSTTVFRQTVWDPVSRRILFTGSDAPVPRIQFQSIGIDGRLTNAGQSPVNNSPGIVGPILVSPSGTYILMGSGDVFNSGSLTKAGKLANGITDAIWQGDNPITLRLVAGLSQLQTWSGTDFATGTAVRQLTGTPLRIFNSPSGIVVITMVDGLPQFTLLNDAFEPVFVSPRRPSAPGNLNISRRTVESVSLAWSDLSNNEDEFRVEYRPVGDAGPWLAGPVVATGATTATVVGLVSGTPYKFRVFAGNGGVLSLAMAPVNASTLAGGEQPIGEPYLLTATRIFHNSITLGWKDNATNETGFRLLRSTTPTGTGDLIATTAANLTTYTDAGLSPGTTYFYRIQVVSGTNGGDISNPITAATMAAAAIPLPPTLLTGSEITTTSLRISWQDNSTNEDSFVVDFFQPTLRVWQELGRTGFNTTSMTLNGLMPNTAYLLRVSSVNQAGFEDANRLNVTTSKIGGDFLGFSMESRGVYYFAFADPNRIERYDLTNRGWLAPIPLQGTATALWVDEAGIYAAEGAGLIRWNPDGSGRTTLATAPSSVKIIFTMDDVLVYQSDSYATLDKRNGTALSNFSSSIDSGGGASYDPILKRFFMRIPQSSLGDIFMLEVGSDGRFIQTFDSPYHGTYPNASRTFIFPSGGRVADDSGTIYTTENLTFVNSLGGAFKDMTFRGTDVPIILRDNKLLAYTNALLQAGSFTLDSANGQRVAVNGTDAIVFMSDANLNGLRPQIVPLSSLNAPQPDQPVNPSGVPYAVDDAFLDRDGVLHLYSSGQFSIFRWSPTQQAYQSTIPLPGAPVFVSYSEPNHSVYTAYASKVIRRIGLGSGSHTEVPFTTLPEAPRALATAGEFVFAAHLSTSSRSSRSLFSPGGNLIQSREGEYDSLIYQWDPTRRRLYSFLHDSSSNGLRYENITTEGLFGGNGISTGDSRSNLPTPARVSPSGDLITINSGIIFNAGDMNRRAALAATFTDTTWQGNLLISLEPQGSTSTVVQRWSDGWRRQQAVAVGGTPLRVFPLSGDRLLVLTRHSSGVPRFHILDSNLTLVHDSIPTSTDIVQQPVSLRVPFGQEARLSVLATGVPPLAYQWFRGTTALPGAVSAILTIPNAGSAAAGVYRVTVSGSAGAITSSNATLSVGPIPTPPAAAGNLLVSNNDKIHEYNPAGVLVRSLNVQFPPSAGLAQTLDLAADALGRIHFLSEDRLLGVRKYYLNSYDAGAGTWRHVLMPGMIFPNDLRLSNLTIAGDWAIAREGRINLLTGQSELSPDGFAPFEVTTGLDGVVYGANQNGIIRRLSLDPPGWSATGIQLASAGGVSGTGNISAAADGSIFAVSNRTFSSYSPTGILLRSLTGTDPLPTVQDLSLSPAGFLAGGSRSGGFILTDTQLNSVRSVTIPSPGSFGTYTAWMPAVTQPAPAFATAETPRLATEDIAWSWTPTVTHPDPDAVLTVSAEQLPAWMSLTNGQLTGTPLQQHVGINTVILNVRDSRSVTARQSFQVQVTEVNDTPVASNLSLNRLEDAMAEAVDLTKLFSDEETATASLTFSVTANTGGIVSARLDSTSSSQLRLGFLPDANGAATVTVRATDVGGLFADSVISLAVAPVNDTPTGSLPPLALDEDAAAISIPLGDFFADIETPDPGLRFTATATDPALAAVTVNGQMLRLTPQANAFGTLTINVRCQDPEGAFVDVAMPVGIASVNDLPTGSLPDLAFDEDAAPIVIDLAAAFTDIETPDAGLRFTGAATSSRVVQANVSGSLMTLTPQKDANGSLAVTVGCRDTDGGSTEIEFKVNVRPVNDPPVIPAALPAIAAGDAARPALIDFTPYVTDPDEGEILRWRVVSNSNSTLFSELEFNDQGRLSIQYAPYVSGQAVITVEVSDLAGTTAQGSFTVDLPALPPPSLDTSGALTLNRQTGLWEQRVIVKNIGLRAIGGFELTITGLPQGATLHNASGSVPGGFLAGSYQPLAAGASITLVLEYYSPTRSTLKPVLTSAVTLPKDAALSVETGKISINRMVMLEPGAFLLEFAAVPGGIYQVQYSNGGAWMNSPVLIRAAGSRVQWIDRGAPRTASPPANSRFYRVIRLPEGS